MRKVRKCVESTSVSEFLFISISNYSPPLLAGNFYLSYVDPVVIGRQAFHSVDDAVGGAVASIRDALCAAVDRTIDAISDISIGLHLLNLFIF